jgi:hypothetical protein
VAYQFRRTLEHATGPVRALRFAGRSLGPGLRGPRPLGPRSLGVPVFGARRLAGLAFCLRLPAPCYLHRAIRRSASSRTPLPRAASSGTALPGTVPCSTALSRTAPFGAAPSGTVPSGTAPLGTAPVGTAPPGTGCPPLGHPAGGPGVLVANWPLSPGQPAGRYLAGPNSGPQAPRALNFPATGLVGMEYEPVLVAAGSRPFACGVQGTPSPLLGVGWGEGPQAGELFTQVPHIARCIVRHAGYHAEGTGPGHPDIWVPPTAL